MSTPRCFVGHSASSASFCSCGVYLPARLPPSGRNGRHLPLTHGNSAETAHKAPLPRVMYQRHQFSDISCIRSSGIPTLSCLGFSRLNNSGQSSTRRLIRLRFLRWRFVICCHGVLSAVFCLLFCVVSGHWSSRCVLCPFYATAALPVTY